MKKRLIVFALLLAMTSNVCGISNVKAAMKPVLEEELGISYGDGVELDEVYDGTSQIVVDADDFDSIENYKAYLEARGMEYSDVESEDTPQSIAAIQSIKATGQYKAGTLYKENNNAIQGFYINGSEIYITQNFKSINFNNVDYNGNGSEERRYVLLSRCTLSGNTFNCEDAMLLVDTGHGQTLDMYNYGGKTYFLFACGSFYIDETEKTWSTQIGRIEYKPGTVLSNSSIKRLTHLKYSNDGATKNNFGTVKRADAALSTDKEWLIIWKRSTEEQDQFSVYDFDAINQQLSASTSNEVSFQNNSVLKKACQFTITDPDHMTTSVQGVELSNLADGIHSMYVASGNEKNEKNDKLNKIYRFNTNGNYKNGAIIDDTGVWALYGESQSKNVKAEIEGVKINGDNLQFVLRNTDTPSQQVIAYVSKGLLK